MFETQSQTSNLPIVSILGSPNEPVREDGSELEIFTFQLSAPAPAGGLTINIVSFDSDGIGGDESISTIGISDIGIDPILNAPFSLTIEEGATEGKLILTPIPDDVPEGTETNYFVIMPGAGYEVNPFKSLAQTAVTDDLISNEQIPTVSILGSPSTPVQEDGSELEVFTFQLSSPAPAGGLTINIVSFDSDGIGGDESISTIGISDIGIDPILNAPFSLTIEEGATEAQLILTPIPDDLPEGIETNYFFILPGTGYNVDPSKSAAQTFLSDLPSPTEDQLIYGNGTLLTLVGGSGNDSLYGSDKAETFLGGAGDDKIYANGGADYIDSGSGMDEVWLGGTSEATIILSTGEGYDFIANYQMGMTRFKGFAESELTLKNSAQGAEIFKGDDKLAVVGWKTVGELSGAFVC